MPAWYTSEPIYRVSGLFLASLKVFSPLPKPISKTNLEKPSLEERIS